MHLTPGQILGDFEILDPLGRGGMGEVHRARDRKLGREVAIKVLPTDLARQVNRRLRFEREARILASLNHPNIAAIYGLQEVDGLLFLVMELAPGEVLSERVKRKPLPVREAMIIAREIAAGLEYAHHRNVIHRDLKPANVVVTTDDAVKVLDFGLAKALKSNPDASEDINGGSQTEAPAPVTEEFDTNRSIPFQGVSQQVDPDVDVFDTIPADEPFNVHAPKDKKHTPPPAPETPEDAVTRIGAIVGTPLYMSPEQARGKDLDYRTDIWAFGCLLYEMLSGVNSFHGESVSLIVTKILEEDPDWERLPAETPPGLLRLLRRCLNKDVHMRLQHIGDARIELTEMLNEPATPEPEPVALPEGRRVRGASLMLFILGVMAGTIISLVAAWSGKRPDALLIPATKLVGLGLEPQISWPGIRDLSMAISPDGHTIAYIARVGESTEVRLRAMDELESTALPGTEGATAACFSPDSRFIAFTTRGELKKLELVSGSITTLVRGYERIAAPSWPILPSIMFTPYPARGIWMVDSEGGEANALTTLNADQNELLHGWPAMIPGTSILLFTVWPGGEEAQPWIEALDLVPTKQGTLGRHKLIDSGQLARFDPIERAIVFARQGTLFAHQFNVRGMTFRQGRDAVPILSDVSRHPQSGLAQYDMAADGTIVYMSGDAPASTYRLIALDRAGARTELDSSDTEISNPRISPDGARLALTLAGLNTDIWVMQSDGKNPLRLTSDSGFDGYPLWSQDGRKIYYSSVQSSSPTLMAMSADGIGTPELLLRSNTRIQADSWTSDGQSLALGYYNPDSLGDILIDNAATSLTQHFAQSEAGTLASSLLPFRVTDRDESFARFSPDARWVAYQQNDGKGAYDIYVQPYGHEATLVRVTENGGMHPAWGRDAEGGRELFYLEKGRLMRVLFDGTSGKLNGEPTLVAEGDFSSGFDVHPLSGALIAVEKMENTESAPDLNLLLDWQSKLDQKPLDAIDRDTNRTTGTGK